MEYNADLVAVSVSGSDAIVFALARLDLASDALNLAWNDLSVAAEHNRFSKDLYFHQTRSAEFIKQKRDNPQLGEVPPLPEDPQKSVAVFKPEDTSVPLMWASHPSNFDREVNAKRRYIRGPIDERSAWTLFREVEKIKESITLKIYESSRPNPPESLEDPEVIQEFIDAEHAETTYDPRYHGCYDNRYLKPGTLEEQIGSALAVEFQHPATLASTHATLYDGLKERMAEHKVRQEEQSRLTQLVGGAVELTGRDFDHRGIRYRPKQAKELLAKVEAEIESDFHWLHKWDESVFKVHLAMASQLDAATRTLLEQRYRFHLALQGIYAQLVAENQNVQLALAEISGNRKLEQNQFQEILTVFRSAHDELRRQLELADKIKLPSMTNIQEGQALGDFLLKENLVRNLKSTTSTLDGEWIGKFLQQLGGVIDRGQRLIFKSLGGLLSLQQQISTRWKEMQDEFARAGIDPA